jgi:hypothetical protein
MAKKNKITEKQFELNDRFIDKFIAKYGAAINNFVLENGGNAKFVQETLCKVILEIYYRAKYNHYDNKADNSILINAITFKVLEKLFKKDGRSVDLKLNVEVLDSEKCKLFTKHIDFNKDEISSVLKSVGEPGRTALKLSFFNMVENDEVVSQIQANTIEDMNYKRMRLLDKCVQLLNKNG